MSDDLYQQVHNQHNLQQSLADFERVITEIFQ
jgi:hypothetical protein